MSFRTSAGQAGWTIREAAWDVEERLLWRGSDAARGALGHAARVLEPLQRVIQTRLAWPLSDGFRARGAWTRAAIAACATAAALAGATAGVITAADGGSSASPARALAPVAAIPQASDTLALQGVTPQFEAGDAAVPATPEPKPTEKPAQVAWEFAQAFVAYEVGRSSKTTDEAFAATATKPLAKALDADPPRLPANGKVPRARVLNVVLGDVGKRQLTASVSLVRLRAISELRLTLTSTDGRWRVAQVLG